MDVTGNRGYWEKRVLSSEILFSDAGVFFWPPPQELESLQIFLKQFQYIIPDSSPFFNKMFYFLPVISDNDQFRAGFRLI